MYFCGKTKRIALNDDFYKNFMNIEGYDFQLRYLDPDDKRKSRSPNASLFSLFDPEDNKVTQVIKFCSVYTPCKIPHLCLRLDRFDREIQALRRVQQEGNSHHVIEILADGHQKISGKTFRYYTMEIAHEDLATFLRTREIERQQKFLLCAEIIECISALHDLGIYHRDIKPGNFLFTDSGNWKIADLGLIDSREEDLAAVDDGDLRERIGPRGFMSPEALNRWLGLGWPVPAIDNKSDVFQLARVMGLILQDKAFCGQLEPTDFLPVDERETLFELLSGAFQYDRDRRFDIGQFRECFLNRFGKKYVIE